MPIHSPPPLSHLCALSPEPFALRSSAETGSCLSSFKTPPGLRSLQRDMWRQRECNPGRRPMPVRLGAARLHARQESGCPTRAMLGLWRAGLWCKRRRRTKCDRNKLNEIKFFFITSVCARAVQQSSQGASGLNNFHAAKFKLRQERQFYWGAMRILWNYTSK